MIFRASFAYAATAWLLLLPACTQQNSEPEVASSASQPRYAQRYPEQLRETHKRLTTQQEVGAEVLMKIPEYPEELKDPDWTIVEQVYQHADEEGRGQAYAVRFEEATTVNRFYSEEKQELVNRTAGGAQHAAKEDGCNTELYGPVAHGMEKGVEKQLEERMRSESEAHAIIEREQDALKNANLETLKKQADQISMMSYVAHIGARNTLQEMERQLAEASSVKSTLESRLEELRASESPDEKEVAAVEAALAQVDEAVNEAEQSQQQAEEGIERFKKEYEKALEALLENVRAKAEQSGGDA